MASKRSPGRQRRHLNPGEHALLRRLVEQQLARIDEVDVGYVIDKGVPEADDLVASDERWRAMLGRQARLLHAALLAWWNEEVTFPWRSVAVMTSGLLYFISPWDLIPDVFPVVGQRDDAAVVAHCVELARTDLRRFARAEGLDLADHGLD